MDKQEERFAFGKNWKKYSRLISEQRILEAESSLKEMLDISGLKNKTFLDIGCGSGLFSLAALRLGAEKVHSFDYDPDSVATAQFLKGSCGPLASRWTIERGDALDLNYLSTLGKFDIVYSWGVLHHTGNLKQALENAARSVKEHGKLFIALYNDQGFFSKCWYSIKKTYNSLPGFLKYAVLIPVFARIWAPPFVKDLLRGKPGQTWKNHYKKRGMSPWYDVVDWVGGFPFEVARPEDVIEFFSKNNFTLTKLKRCGRGHGNNEFVFTNTGKQ
jgi:SAM-dependent methyltransferase